MIMTNRQCDSADRLTLKTLSETQCQWLPGTLRLWNDACV